MAPGMTDTGYSDCRGCGQQQSERAEALVNAAKFTAAQNRIADPVDQLNASINQLISRYYFWISLFCSCLLQPGLARN
jgi:hypothetical protein